MSLQREKDNTALLSSHRTHIPNRTPSPPHPFWLWLLGRKGKKEKEKKVHSLVISSIFPPEKEWILSVNGPTPLFFSCLDKAFIRQKKRAGPLLQTAVHVSLYSWSIFVHNKPKMIQESSWRLLCFTRLALVPQKEGLWEKKVSVWFSCISTLCSAGTHTRCLNTQALSALFLSFSN